MDLSHLAGQTVSMVLQADADRAGSVALWGAPTVSGARSSSHPNIIFSRISDLAVVPYRQDQSPRLDFWGSDVRNDTREGDTLCVNYTTSHFSSRSTVS